MHTNFWNAIEGLQPFCLVMLLFITEVAVLLYAFKC